MYLAYGYIKYNYNSINPTSVHYDVYTSFYDFDDDVSYYSSPFAYVWFVFYNQLIFLIN